MAATVYGTAHLFGVTGTVSNATVTDDSFDDVCARMDAVQDETGIEIERRYDDVTVEGTITLIIRSAYTVPAPGTTVTYNSITYEIQKVGRRASNKNFRVVELGVKKSAGISYP